MRVAEIGVQVHGGMGFIEETGAAQFGRDVRVTAIYEGTNGIQAMDLVGRKLADGGEAAMRLLDEVQAGAEAARAGCRSWPAQSGTPPRSCARPPRPCSPAARTSAPPARSPIWRPSPGCWAAMST